MDMKTKAPLTDIATLRKNARQHVDEGAVTAGYSADRQQVLKLLNDSLATELICVLRYRRHYFMARGIHGQAIFVDPASKLVLVHTAVRLKPSNDPAAQELTTLWYALVEQYGGKQ